MKRQGFLLLFSVLVGAGAGALVVSMIGAGETPSVEADESIRHSLSGQNLEGITANNGTGELDDLLQRLISTLNEEVSQRQQLSEQLDELQTEVSELRAEIRGSDTPSDRVGPVEAENRFVEMGFSPQDRESIRTLQAETRLRAVEIDDLARREGWVNTARYGEEMRALSEFDNPIRDSLGDDQYDRYLFAMGRPNRIMVGSLMESSPAEKAGLKGGDVILRYGGEPVFSSLHMVNLRSSGTPGEPVIVEVVRNGQPMVFTMPRGPMGFGGIQENIDPRTNIWVRDE